MDSDFHPGTLHIAPLPDRDGFLALCDGLPRLAGHGLTPLEAALELDQAVRTHFQRPESEPIIFLSNIDACRY